jgi:hypothetical protein
VAAAWANELDQVKALADRSVGLYQTFYAGVVRFTAGDEGETMKVDRIDRIVQDFANRVES